MLIREHNTSYSDPFRFLLIDAIMDRDDYKCQVCGNIKNLDVHYIDYNKSNSHAFNLIALCHNCLYKTMFHRRDWVLLFADKMYHRFPQYGNYLKKIGTLSLYKSY